MNKFNENFSDQLLNQEKPDLALKEKYNKEIKEMINEKLTVAKKCQMILVLKH